MSVKPSEDANSCPPTPSILHREDLTEILELVLKVCIGIFWIDGEVLRVAKVVHTKAEKPGLKWLTGEMVSSLKQLLCALEGGRMDTEK